ncbi:MAG: thioredoxin family protein [Candidatus Omnitrophica bacterium]|nr:thioredoxin family protein [Candidatus Omnitrophota bacterium]
MELSPLALLGVFFSGLALNLTPCVYPMFSVTVALFSARGEKREERLLSSFLHALFYVAGMVCMYSALGVFAALTGGFFGAILQNQWVLLGMSLLMFILALSMFGLYELQMPAAILNWLGGIERAGTIGFFISGLCVGVFAAPCIGPPIVALLAFVGQARDPWSGFFLFFVLALGLGMPYLILGTFSGLLTKLPKSGEWLVWVKKVFGVALLGLALFYLALSLYAELLPFVLPVTLIGGGVFLGFMDQTGNQKIAFRAIKQSMGGLAVLIAAISLFSKPVQGVVWDVYAPQKIEAAKRVRKPVVIDFYADWCIPCHELERFTYSKPEVIQALEPFVRLKVDATDPDTKEVLEPIERFEILGVPTVLFLGPDGKEISDTRITGFVSAKEFVEVVQVAAQRVNHKNKT